jgi:hypothetical protein
MVGMAEEGHVAQIESWWAGDAELIDVMDDEGDAVLGAAAAASAALAHFLEHLAA